MDAESLHRASCRKTPEFDETRCLDSQGWIRNLHVADSEDGIDHGNRVGPMMATCAPESSSVHSEVEPNSQNSGLPQEFDLGGGSRAGVICPHHSPQAGDAQVQFCVCFAQFDTILLMDGWPKVRCGLGFSL